MQASSVTSLGTLVAFPVSHGDGHVLTIGGIWLLRIYRSTDSLQAAIDVRGGETTQSAIR